MYTQFSGYVNSGRHNSVTITDC